MVSVVRKLAFVALASLALAGCVIEPIGPRWHPYYYR